MYGYGDPPRLSRHTKLTVAKYYALPAKRPSFRKQREISLRLTKAHRLFVAGDFIMTPQSPERLWYYYNQLFEVKTLLTFSTG
jgi:hypothetical protein